MYMYSRQTSAQTQKADMVITLFDSMSQYLETNLNAEAYVDYNSEVIGAIHKVCML